MYVLLAVTAVIIVSMGASFWAFTQAMQAETNVRYVGLQNIVSEKMSKTILGIETNAKHVFDEVGRHLDSPDAVIATMERKTSLGPEVRGYFAAFVPEYFPGKGRWFEPYVHHVDSSEFFAEQSGRAERVLDMVGSARHDYTLSDWYIRGKDAEEGFWCDPYEYDDGTSITGLYSSYIEPVFDASGRLACVCGADITFEWLTKELLKIDDGLRSDEALNKYRLMRSLDFFSVVIDKDGSCIVYPDGKHILLRATRTDASVCFTVEDTGPGMSADICDLDPTTKSDSLSEATGLGLPLTKRHVAAMDGKIIIDEDYHDGCRISVELSLVNCILPNPS